MARTRSKGASAAATAEQKSAAAKPTNSIYKLPAESGKPAKLFIIPDDATPDARMVALQNPRYNKPTRYLVCPKAGFFEFTRISPPPKAPESWLLTPPTGPATTENSNAPNKPPTQITQFPDLYVATPMDPLFLLIPALLSPNNSNKNNNKKPRMFISLDDHLDQLANPSRHLSEVLSWPHIQQVVESRLADICDTVEAGGETMYRANEDLVFREVLYKAQRMAAGSWDDTGAAAGLPTSLEERFVTRALEAPVLGVRVVRQGQGPGQGVKEREQTGTPSETEGESQSSVESSGTEASLGSEVSAATTAATSVTDADADAAGADDVVRAMAASEEVVKLQRVRVAFDFICSMYIAPEIAEVLKAALAKATDLVDLKPLDEYLARLAKLRQDAAAARTTDFSRKRTADEEEDERAEKRRKKEAEEKVKKANQSRGVRELAKVNTSGMKKLSEFFKKMT
jgi:hypothetical protein